MSTLHSLPQKVQRTDVLICGAGLAGLTLALQLKRDMPQLDVTLVDRLQRPLPKAAHKVGESSVEIGSLYLERLGLLEYLREHHIVKLGLRFFPGGGHGPLQDRLELGPDAEPIARSWQLDRGIFETDLRQLVVEQGCTLFEGATVRRISLGDGGGHHDVVIHSPQSQLTITCRWLIDASGRTGLLRRRLNLKETIDAVGHSAWFRTSGRLDISDLVPKGPSAGDWHDRPMAAERWRSTNHLMGDGYWIWLIPLGSGHTSVGAVIHDETHGFEAIRTRERLLDFIAQHEPVLSKALQDRALLDFRALKNYAHRSVQHWSVNRWALVGEAGSFSDPFYSPGTDLIAQANTFTVEVIRADIQGGDLDLRVNELEEVYQRLWEGSMTVYHGIGPILGHRRAMAAKIYWDNFAYWSYPSQFFAQDLHRLSGAELRRYVALGSRFVALSAHVQSLLRQWALLDTDPPQPSSGQFHALPAFPSVLIDAHCAILESRSPEQAYEALAKAVEQAHEMVSELVIRVISELGPQRAATLMEAIAPHRWDGVGWTCDRVEAESKIGLARRKSLSRIARDVERALGRVTRHPDALGALSLLTGPAPEDRVATG